MVARETTIGTVVPLARKARAQGAAGAVVTARKQGGRAWLRIEVPADEAAVPLGATRRRGR